MKETPFWCLLLPALLMACAPFRNSNLDPRTGSAIPTSPTEEAAAPHRSGLLIFLSPPDLRFHDLLLPLDFSELDPGMLNPYSNEFATLWGGAYPAVVQPDLFLDPLSFLDAPYGVYDMGEFIADMCYEASLMAEGLIYFEQFFLHDPVEAPLAGYTHRLPFSFCHLYILKTSEGNFTLLWNVGNYVGGIDRNPLLWIYLPDGERIFLPPR